MCITNLCVPLQYQNKQTMKTIIFKNEKKAKVYKEISLLNQGIYTKGEIIRTIKTDKIENLTNEYYSTTFEEVK